MELWEQLGAGVNGAAAAMGGVGAAGATKLWEQVEAMGAEGAVGDMGAVGDTEPVGATGAVGGMGAVGGTVAVGGTGATGVTGAVGGIGAAGGTARHVAFHPLICRPCKINSLFPLSSKNLFEG